MDFATTVHVHVHVCTAAALCIFYKIVGSHTGLSLIIIRYKLQAHECIYMYMYIVCIRTEES